MLGRWQGFILLSFVMGFIKGRLSCGRSVALSPAEVPQRPRRHLCLGLWVDRWCCFRESLICDRLSEAFI